MTEAEIIETIRRVLREELSARLVDADARHEEARAREDRRPRDPDGYAYFFQCPSCDLVKIGFSRDISTRLATVQCIGCSWPHAYRLIGCLPGGRAEERNQHRRHANDRLYGGEWFRFDEGTLSAIRADCAARGWLDIP